jgi:hypothetical protein
MRSNERVVLMPILARGNHIHFALFMITALAAMHTTAGEDNRRSGEALRDITAA